MSYVPPSPAMGESRVPGDLGPPPKGPHGPPRSQDAPSSLFGLGCGSGGLGFGLGVTVDWQQLAGVSYRRQTIFTMLWENPRILENSVVAVAPWGGPVAAVRSEKVFQPATNKLMPELQVSYKPCSLDSVVDASPQMACGC